jgi:hypothetical protein
MATEKDSHTHDSNGMMHIAREDDKGTLYIYMCSQCGCDVRSQWVSK